jgi:phage protein D
MAVDDTALRASRPTVALDGRESPSLTGGLLRARVREDVHGLYDCEVEIGNWGPAGGPEPGFLFFDRRVLDFGKELSLSVAGRPLFAGRVTGLEARFPAGDAPSIVALAEDRFQDLRMTRRTRTFADVTDGDVAARLAGDHGLTPDVGVHGPTHEVLAQLNQSDLAFLRERARALDAELWMTDRTLSLQPRARRAASPLTLTYGKELRDFRVVADLAGQATSIEVTGWDVAGKAAIDERADDGVLGGEVGNGDSGPSILRSAFGERRDTLASAVPQTGAEARERAGALLKRRARRFLVGTGTAETEAGLRVGATLRLAGLGPLFEGDFYVSAATHLFDGAAGLRTEFTVERPGLGRGA